MNGWVSVKWLMDMDCLFLIFFGSGSAWVESSNGVGSLLEVRKKWGEVCFFVL